MKQERYVIRGLRATELVWNMETSSWNFVNLRTKKIIAYTNDTDDYPLGTHKWIFSEGGCYDNNRVNYRRMNLHSCEDTDFICNDGQCIGGELRCDCRYNCHDFSDEENCTIFTVPNYDKNSPPQIITEENEPHQMPLLDVFINIISVV